MAFWCGFWAGWWGALWFRAWAQAVVAPPPRLRLMRGRR